jgi:hypothetical protein
MKTRFEAFSLTPEEATGSDFDVSTVCLYPIGSVRIKFPLC